MMITANEERATVRLSRMYLPLGDVADYLRGGGGIGGGGEVGGGGGAGGGAGGGGGEKAEETKRRVRGIDYSGESASKE